MTAPAGPAPGSDWPVCSDGGTAHTSTRENPFICADCGVRLPHRWLR